MSTRSVGLRLLNRFGPDLCVIDGDQLAHQSSDPWGSRPGSAAALLFPRHVDHVSGMVQFCIENGIELVPQGGGTGLVSGATPDMTGQQVIINLSRLNGIREIDVLNYTITVEAGCILADVQAAALAQQRLFAPSFGAEGTCQIGGIISTNAGGHNVLRYGNTRDSVLGLEVVLADGSILHGLRKLRKDNTGYDLKQLFIGAEGTLGIITAAVFKLYSIPRASQTVMVALSSVEAVPQLLSEARELVGDFLGAFEIVPLRLVQLYARHFGPVSCVPPGESQWYALLEFSSTSAGRILEDAMMSLLEQALEKGLILDATVATNSAQRDQMWRLRDSVAEAQIRNGLVLYFDVAVAVSQTPTFIHSASQALRAFDPTVDINAFGHAGDGNIHFNLLQPRDCSAEEFRSKKHDYERIVYTVVERLGGSFSAEHGVGFEKVDQMRQAKSPLELRLMRLIRAAISDPTMNPGKLIPANEETVD